MRWSAVAVNEFRDSVGAALLWFLMLPGVLPLLAVTVLVLGLRRARKVPRPAYDAFGVIVIAGALVDFSLIPAYAKYVHARRVDEVWFCQFLGLAVPFALLLAGLGAMDRGNKARNA